MSVLACDRNWCRNCLCIARCLPVHRLLVLSGDPKLARGPQANACCLFVSFQTPTSCKYTAIVAQRWLMDVTLVAAVLSPC